MARKVLIQILYGLEMNIGALNPGEMGYCTDTQKLYIGTSSGNVLLVAAQTVGDMLRSIYDTDNDGIVDAAEKVNGHTVQSDVPAGAKFTDTVYTHPSGSGYKHIPSGGALGQVLRWSANGAAAWGEENSSITKSDIGLGSLSNYGIATQAEAEAGTSAVKYMTPLRVSQAIAAKAMSVGATTWEQLRGV